MQKNFQMLEDPPITVCLDFLPTIVACCTVQNLCSNYARVYKNETSTPAKNPQLKPIYSVPDRPESKMFMNCYKILRIMLLQCSLYAS